jgi:outer membrane protein assembly factor BamA
MTDYYRDQGFLDCEVRSYFRGHNPGDLQLTYFVNEGYRYKLSNIVFVGNKRLSSEELREGLPLRSGNSILKTLVEDGKKTIIDKYRAVGCQDARIVSATPRPTTGMGPVDRVDKVDLIYEIEESKP